MPLSRRPSLRRALAPGFALALLCAGIFLAPRQFDAGLTTAAAPQVAADTIRELPLVTNDLVYDPATKLIYASVPGRMGAGGNSITPIDPSQSAAGTPVFVGSEPRKMALSDNGQYIYVGLDGAGAVRRYDVAAHAPDLFFDIGGVGARDIAVVPGNPHAVAVSRTNSSGSPDFAGVALYDDGVRRPDIAATTDNISGGNFIEFSSSPSVLYCSAGTRLQRISVMPSGLSVVKSTPVTSGGDMKFSGGLLYMPKGQVIDPETETVVGTYDLEQPGAVGTTFLVLPDPEFDRVYFLVTEGGGNLVLRVYQKSNFQFIDKRVIAPAFSFDYSSLVRWGTHGLAFRTDKQVFLIQTPLVPSPEPLPPAPPSPTPTPTPTPVPTPAPGELRILTLPANDLVVDPRSQTLYASVAASGGAAADSVTPIDPVSGATGTPVPVGPTPNRMDISDDGRFIYVGIDGASAVRRYDVDAHAAGAQFSIVPEGASGQWRAQNLAVVPGHPESVVVARRSVSSDNATAVVYDEGVPRPGVDIFHAADVLEFSSNPSVLYSHANVIGSNSFQKMAVASCGVGAATSVAGLLGSFISDFKVDNGLVYSTAARVVDPETGTRLGVFPFGDTSLFNTPVFPDSKAGRVYFIAGSTTSTHTLFVFDQHTFTEIGRLRLPGSTGVISGLVRWGTNGLAYRTSDNQVVLIQHPLVAPQTLSPTPAPVPTPLTFNIAGRVEQIPSFGALPLANATATLTGSQNATAPIDAEGKFSFSNVAPCGDYTVTPSATLTDFSPPSRSYAKLVTNQTASFDAFVRRFSIFASPTVAETGGQFFLSVMRTGADKGPATIDYATSDGTASERSDYTPAVGTLRFATNETTKFLFIHVTNDALNEAPETLTLTFSNATGALPPPATSLTLTINSEDSADGPSPVAGDSFDAPFFVRQHYLDFLGRAPDASGASFWAGQTTNCGNADLLVCRINVSAAFFLSIEFQQTGFLVYKTHGAAFGTRRVGDAVPLRLREFLPDTQTIGAGVIVNQGAWQAQLEANKIAFFEEFVSRAAFVAAYPASLSAAQYVDALNANAGGALSTTERNQLVADLNAGALTRGQVLRAVAENDTFSAREKNRAFVLMQYFGYLRRNPDDAPEEKRNFDGFNFWLGKLNDNGGNFVRAEMVKAFITSDEYRKRFGQ